MRLKSKLLGLFQSSERHFRALRIGMRRVDKFCIFNAVAAQQGAGDAARIIRICRPPRVVRPQSDKANRAQESNRKGNQAVKAFSNKAANRNRPTRKPNIRHRRRALGLYWNPPARGSSIDLARYRHGRKDNHSTLAMLQDGRRTPSRNSACARQNFGRTV